MDTSDSDMHPKIFEDSNLTRLKSTKIILSLCFPVICFSELKLQSSQDLAITCTHFRVYDCFTICVLTIFFRIFPLKAVKIKICYCRILHYEAS